MTMYHHDARSYQTAASEAIEHFKKNLQTGIQRAAGGMRQLQERVISDTLQPLSDLKYTLDGRALRVNGNAITGAALTQLCAQTKLLKPGYCKDLLSHSSPLAQELAIDTLETLSALRTDQMTMLRSVDGVIRGAVTDAYKRMDSRLIVGTFADVIREGKLCPVQCELSETKIYVRALMPRIYGEEFGEALAFGLELRASDFGFGNVELLPFVDRVWCTNKAYLTLPIGKGFKKAHRGARLTEETFALSARTQELQIEAMASEMRDGISGILSEDAIKAYSSCIARCFAEQRSLGSKFDAIKELDKLVTARKLSEKQAKYIGEAYASPDRSVVPAEPGRWKLAQAIAYAAQHMNHITDHVDATNKAFDVTADLEWLAGEVVAAAPAGAILAASN